MTRYQRYNASEKGKIRSKRYKETIRGMILQWRSVLKHQAKQREERS